jgi:hypothetical protein
LGDEQKLVPSLQRGVELVVNAEDRAVDRDLDWLAQLAALVIPQLTVQIGVQPA